MASPRRRRAAGLSSLREAARLLTTQSVLDLERRIRLDLSREERTGIPEVVVAEGKRPEALRQAAKGFLDAHGRAILTRCTPATDVSGLDARVERHDGCGVIFLRRTPRAPRTGGRVALLTGGASDARVAEEAGLIAAELGCQVRREEDVGVASLLRAVAAVARLSRWRPHAWIVCAGREGALAPVVAGLVEGPVIGVPVSTGYGYRGRGEAALSTMIQSCSPLVVVNIDAGFVAGAVAAQIANRVARAERPRRRSRAH